MGTNGSWVVGAMAAAVLLRAAPAARQAELSKTAPSPLQQQDAEAEQTSTILPPDAARRWSVRPVDDHPTGAELAERLRGFFSEAKGFRVETTVEHAGQPRFRAVATMAAGSLRLDLFNPDGTRYGACSWIDGVQFEYRPEMDLPGAGAVRDCLLESQGAEVAVIQPTLILSYDELCLVGNVCESWLGPIEEGRQVVPEKWANWLQEGLVLGEAEVSGSACWVIQREYGAEGFHAQHVYFADKDSGVLRRYATTQTTDTSIERVRDYQIAAYPKAPIVDWRLRDLAPESQPEGEKP